MKCEKLYPWGFRPVGFMRTPYITPHLSRRAGTEFRMSCEVCLYGAYSNCPCCGPEDDGESTCGGEGLNSDCDGCEDCIVEVRRTSYHTARRPHHGLLVGDKYARTTGFDYQVGGGRTYVRPAVRRVARGPNHPAVLVETGVLPPVAQERAALTARYAEVAQKAKNAFYATVPQSIGEAEALLDAARTVGGEVDAFVALHDANNALRLRSGMVAAISVTDTLWRAGQNLDRSKRKFRTV